MATLVASWEEYARSSRSAMLRRHGSAAIAVFSNEPERAVYNNALLPRSLAANERVDALEGIEATYGAADITSFAAWVHESDGRMQDDLEARGYVLSESSGELAEARRPTGRPSSCSGVPTTRLEPAQRSATSATWG